MSLMRNEIEVRKRGGSWKVYKRAGMGYLPVGFPHHREFRTWRAAYTEADKYARQSRADKTLGGA